MYQLLGGNRISISELKEFAARQQQEIAAKEKELKAKQVQFIEMRRKLQNKPQNPSVQQLSAKADEQEQRLRELRHAQDQTDSYKLSNGALGTFGILTFLLSASLFSLIHLFLHVGCECSTDIKRYFPSQDFAFSQNEPIGTKVVLRTHPIPEVIESRDFPGSFTRQAVLDLMFERIRIFKPSNSQ